jgi:hypothetical protein
MWLPNYIKTPVRQLLVDICEQEIDQFCTWRELINVQHKCPTRTWWEFMTLQRPAQIVETVPQRDHVAHADIWTEEDIYRSEGLM